MDYERERPTAADYYSRLAELRQRPAGRELYHELYSLMRQLCEDCCEGMTFSNMFSMLGWVCDARGVDKRLTAALQDVRRRAHLAAEPDEATLRRDVRVVADLVERLHGAAVPDELKNMAPADYRVASRDRVVGTYRALRARVQAVEADHLLVQADEADSGGALLRVALTDEEHGADWTYLRDLAHRGSTLSLLDVRLRSSGNCVARWVVYEPDFLMSPSELAAVFEPNAVLPENYFIKTLQPKESTYYTMLGLASGQMLDDLVFQSPAHEATYAESVRRAFERYPLDFTLLMSDPELARRFHQEARAQFANIKQLVEWQLEPVYGFDLARALLEPSFVCPAAGLAGRMDYMQTDGHRLIEQKSGKRDEFRNTHKEPHYVQMMLYQLMIEYCMGLPRGECHAYLLYSRYPDGLMAERPYVELLRQAIEVRNRIVAQYERMAEGGARDFFEGLRVDDFRQRNVSDKLWLGYVRPRLEEVLAPFGSEEVAKSQSRKVAKSESCRTKEYFYRFYGFLAREQWLARMGATESGAHGYADLWNNPALVRTEGGDMYGGLRVLRLEADDGSDSVGTVVFSISEQDRLRPTNFRLGDSVQIYAYNPLDGEPNVARQFTLRGRLAALRHDEVEVRLSNAQRNKDIFSDGHTVFALEHDRVEAGNALLTSGLYSLLTASREVQERYFIAEERYGENTNHTPPSLRDTRFAPPCYSSGLEGEPFDYGAFSGLVAQSVRARELFLVIGPPGSGKTSRALRYMVEEHLRRLRGGKLLLMAYTNRAVDELCAMLEEIIADAPQLLDDYLRFGSSLSAAEELRPRLLQERQGGALNSVGQVQMLLKGVRVLVGTTTSMMQRQQMLRQMRVEAAFIDEASQILEPSLLPFFTLGCIEKFVLVGDQKQLPAVVMQSRGESEIDCPELRNLGFENCADSIFHRMLHRLAALGRSDLYTQIETQGRMHPELYGFVNDRFYRGRLSSVPLAHQRRGLGELYPTLPQHATALTEMLAQHRALFIDCEPADDGVNDKVNSAEADVIASCLMEFARLYEANGRRLEAKDVGIIVPYRNQIGMLRTRIAERGLEQMAEVSIDTVERYQGSQRDIILYSFTARHASQLGFLTSSTYMEDDTDGGEAYPVDRKLNVALTRAREQMVLVGNAKLLRRNRIFADLIDSLPRYPAQE